MYALVRALWRINIVPMVLVEAPLESHLGRVCPVIGMGFGTRWTGSGLQKVGVVAVRVRAVKFGFRATQPKTWSTVAK